MYLHITYYFLKFPSFALIHHQSLKHHFFLGQTQGSISIYTNMQQNDGRSEDEDEHEIEGRTNWAANADLKYRICMKLKYVSTA